MKCDICRVESKGTMALDKMAQELVDETMAALKDAPFTHDALLRVSPRRMRALILYTQQRLQVQMNGNVITLEEDANAPELAQEIADVCGYEAVSEDADDDAPTPAELAAVRAMRAAK